MKQLGKNKLLIAVAIVWTFIPVRSGNSQSQKDSIIQRVDSFGDRVEAVSQKANLIESKLQSYPEKVQTFDSLISLVPKQRTIVRIKKAAAIKEKLSGNNLPALETGDKYYTDEQYIDRPVIIYRTCDVRYGGDNFRTNMWKAPGEDGLIKQLFKRKKK